MAEVCVRLDEMPLTESVEFLARLQKLNRVQIPVEVRWRYKLGPGEPLKVDVYPIGGFSVGSVSVMFWLSFLRIFECLRLSYDMKGSRGLIRGVFCSVGEAFVSGCYVFFQDA